MSVNIQAEVSQRTYNVPVEVNTLLQDIEVDLSSSIIYAFSPTAKVERMQDGDNYLITITDKNGTTTAIVPIIDDENIDRVINQYFQEHPIIQQLIQQHNISAQAHQDIRNLINQAIGMIPTKVSQLRNDKKYISNFKELLVIYPSYREFPNIPPETERNMIFLDKSTGDMFVFGLNNNLTYTSIGISNQDNIYGGDSNTKQTKIFLRNDTAANWTINNPTLGKGQIGVEIDTKKFKFGDGQTPWNTLGYGAGADIALASASVNGLMSSSDFSKLAGIANGAQANVIEVVKVNGTALTITSKAVNVTVPTKTSDITNDSGFITTSDIPEGAAASTTTPAMDGTAAVGIELAFARGDHVHPSDTTKVDKVTGKGLSTNDYTTEEKNKLAGIAAGAQVNVQSDWNASSGDAAILNKPTTLAGYGITDAMTATAIETAINTAISAVFSYKGTKATVDALPASGNSTGDVWHVTATSGEYVWNGSAWQELGSAIDLSGYLQSVSIAGITLTPSSYTITVAQLKTALGLGDAAYKGVDTSIAVGSTSTKVPTSAAVATYVANNSTKVESSTTNGNIKINNVETQVYRLPTTTLDSSDTLILDCGNSTTNYT